MGSRALLMAHNRPSFFGYDNALPKQGVSFDSTLGTGATFRIAGCYTNSATGAGYTTPD
jgi:hypothetical protein